HGAVDPIGLPPLRGLWGAGVRGRQTVGERVRNSRRCSVVGLMFHWAVLLTALVNSLAPAPRPPARSSHSNVHYLSLSQAIELALRQYASRRPGVEIVPGGRTGLTVRARDDLPRLAIEREVNQLLLDVETAYWGLYAAQQTLYSRA